jgi:MCM P-loop domain
MPVKLRPVEVRKDKTNPEKKVYVFEEEEWIDPHQHYYCQFTKDFRDDSEGDLICCSGIRLAELKLNECIKEISEKEYKEIAAARRKKYNDEAAKEIASQSQQPQEEKEEAKNTDKLKDWGFTEEECEELNEEQIKGFYKKHCENPEALKTTPLNMIKGYGNQMVKTQIRVDAIEKGFDLIKGWECLCSECNTKKTIYNPFVKTQENFCKCFGYSKQGKMTFEKIERKELRDTGYWLEVSDPKEQSSITTQNVFISLNKLPKNFSDIQEFERLIQTNIVEIVGIIRTKPSKERNWIETFIDVEAYKIVDMEYKYEIPKIKKLDGIKRDELFFEEYFAPSVYGSVLQKKIQAIMLCNPHEVQFPNGEIRKGFIKSLRAGDPGQAKTVLAKKGYVEYSPFINFYSVENATTKGLVMTTRKSKSGSKWTTTLGVLPKHHKGGVVLDGIGKLDQNAQSELRGVKEEGIAQSTKASGNTEAPAFVNILSLGNIKRYIQEYPSKHSASYDVAINTDDRGGKFSGADRRREDFVIVVANEDLNTQAVGRGLLKGHKQKDFDDVDYWNNINSFAWSRQPQQITWDDNIVEDILESVEKLNNDYKNFELEYGILGKNGTITFTKMLPGVAILNGSIEDENVIVKKEHVKWLYQVFEDMFVDLGLSFENEKEEYYNSQAQIIFQKSNEPQKEIIRLLSVYGSQSAIEKAGKYTRKTIYNKLKTIIDYEVTFEDDKKERLFYSFLDGSCDFELVQGREEYSPNGDLKPIMKRDGSFTEFGKTILRYARETGKRPHRKIKMVNDDE